MAETTTTKGEIAKPGVDGGKGPAKSGTGAVATASTGPKIAFAIEIAGKQNESVMCPIDQQNCRGRWARKNLIGKTYDGEFAAMPDIPGLCLVVNSARKRVRRFDPLADPNNERILKRAQKIGLTTMGVKFVPSKQKLWEDADDDTIKTFCWWAMRLVDSNLCEVVSGHVPTWQEIKTMPGTIQMHQFDSKAGAIRGVPDAEIKYMKPEKPDDDEEFRGDEELPDPVIGVDDASDSDE